MPFLTRYVKFCLYGAALAPLLFFLGFSSPYIFTQVFFFKVCVLLALLPAAYIVIWDRGLLSTLRSPIFISFWIFIAVMGVTSLLGSAPQASFIGEWGRFGSVLDWICLGFYLSMLLIAFRTRQAWHNFLYFQVGVSGLAALVALAQLLPGGPFFFSGARIFGSLGNPAFLASYLLLSAGLAAYFFYSDASRKRRFLFALAFVIYACAIYFTFVRTVYVGFVFALFILTAWSFVSFISRQRQLRVRLTLGLIACAIGATVVLYGFPIIGQQFARGLSAPSTRTRYVVWQEALDGFRERPLTGWGEGNFSIVFQRFFRPELYMGFNDSSWFDRAHNEFLDRLVSGGLAGLAVFIIMLCMPFLDRGFFLLRMRNGPLLALQAFLIAYYVYLLLFFQSIGDSMLFTVYLAFLASWLTGREKKDSTHGHVSVPKALIAFAVACGIGAGIVFSIKPITASLLVREGEQSESSWGKIAAYQKAWGLTRSGKKVMVTDLATFLSTKDPSSADVIRAYRYACGWSHEALKLHPYDARLWLIRAQALRECETGMSVWDVSISAIDAAISLSPNHPLPYHMRGLLLFDKAIQSEVVSQQKNFFEIARSNFYHAYQLNPRIYESQIAVAAIDDILEKNGDCLNQLVAHYASSFSSYEVVLAAQFLAARGDTIGLQLLTSIMEETGEQQQLILYLKALQI